MDDHGFVLDEGTTSFVVAPDAPGFRVSGRPAEDPPEHLERGIHPVRLIDGRGPISFDARDEEDYEDALAPTRQNWAAGGLLRFFAIQRSI